MEEFILIRPTSEYATQIIEYRQEFLDAGDSMDGTGPLRRTSNPEEYIQICLDHEDPLKVPSHLVPATQFFFIRKSEGCSVVEMECSALAACAAFRGATWGMILYTADSLADVDKYDERNWGGNAYEYALTLCLDAVLKI